MITGELPGKRTVKFHKNEDGVMVGKIEGNDLPVYVNKKSIMPKPGESWRCHVHTVDESGVKSLLATLEENVGYEEPVKAPVEDEYVIDEPKDEPAKEEETLKVEEEYKIVDDPMDMIRRRPARMRAMIRGRAFAMATGEDEEEDSDFVRYNGNGVLFSNVLVHSRYMAFRSADGSAIQLAPCREGGFRCVGRKVRIGILEEMLGDRVGCMLRFENEDGILTVHLDLE